MPDVQRNLIGGAWTPSAGQETLEVRDPATDEPVGIVPAGAGPDAAAAVAAAAKAAPGWARTSAAERAGLLRAAAARVREHADDLAELTTREMGKPVGDALGGVLAGVGAIEQYAELGPRHRGKALHGGWDATDLMIPEPYGVAAVLTPWNDPVAISAQNIAAALVTGNTVVYKPSERAPHTAVRLVELLVDGLPAGALNLVLGDGRVGRALVGAEVDLVVHVGSTATGREIATTCAARGTKAVLENGGNDPLVVDADVDPIWAAEQAALGCFANAGQLCTSVERIYAHEAIAAPFLDALVARAERLRLGPGLEERTTLGPLVDPRHRAAVHAQVQSAVAAGARLRHGGVVPPGPGAFYPPTVLTDCAEDMAVLRDETFGPVAPVRVVSSYDEALALAASSRFGLAATVLTGSAARAQRAWRELPVGTVKVNAVFGGAPGGAAEPRGASGSGYGYGPELLDEVTRTKVVHLSPIAGGC